MRNLSHVPNPRHRIRALETLSRAPEDDTERAIVVLLHGEEALNELTPLRPWREGTAINEFLVYATSLYQTLAQRPYIEASLISTEDDEIIAKSFKFAQEEVEYYRNYFFDTNVFRNRVQIVSYIAGLPEDSMDKQLMSLAYNNGFGALRYHFTPDKELIDETEVLRTTMTDAFYRSQAHRGRPLTSKASKESLRWAQTAVTCSKMLMKDEANPATTKDIEFKFVEGSANLDIHTLENEGIKVVH